MKQLRSGLLFCCIAAALWTSTISAATIGISAAASAAAHQGPNVISSSILVNQNGVQTNITGNGGGTSSTSTGTPVTSLSATASQPGGAGDNVFSGTAYAAATLNTGQVRASYAASGPNNFGTPMGGAHGEFTEMVTFSNTSGSSIVLPFSYAIDGFMVTPYDSMGGVAYGQIYISNATGNDQAMLIGKNTPGDTPGLRTNFHSAWGQYNTEMFSNASIPFGSGATWTVINTSTGGNLGAIIQSALIIPAGITSVLVNAMIDVDCRSGSSCNFGNTATFAFGPNPQGLSWTSSSGVFLSGDNQPPLGAVPEPASCLLAGLGLLGLAAARTRRAR